jgi:SAM-dependent methyltransferase
MNNHFRPAVFDIVVGAAILHHILDVKRTLCSVHAALAPGGVAIFFEPFEAGSSILRMAFQHILEFDDATTRSNGNGQLQPEPTLNADMRSFLRRRIVEFDRRISPDIDIKKSLDDKWYFTRAYFEEVAREIGFSSLLILNNQATENPLLVQTATFLRNGLGLTRDALPTFAWDILKSYEKAMSAYLKKDMMTTGTIILTR